MCTTLLKFFGHNACTPIHLWTTVEPSGQCGPFAKGVAPLAPFSIVLSGASASGAPLLNTVMPIIKIRIVKPGARL